MATFDRYSPFRDGNDSMIPFVEIPQRDTDIYEIYHKGDIRLDQLSYQYYNNSDYGWLILQANPQYGALEFNIPDEAEIRIPYPLEVALKAYQEGIEKYRKYN